MTHQSRKDEDICIQGTVIDMHLCCTATVYASHIKLNSSIATCTAIYPGFRVQKYASDGMRSKGAN